MNYDGTMYKVKCLQYITRHTLVWNGIMLAVFSLSGYRYLGNCRTEWREILHHGTYRSLTELSPFGGSEILGQILTL